jgi:prepilin-type N-terminal cleavage/methylation domain-containing protein
VIVAIKKLRLWASASRHNRTRGLTLLECLVAISVIGLSSGIIAPVMVFSVATRVQSQKAEKALQLAQAEVDSIRAAVERGGDYNTSFLSGYPTTPKTEATISTTLPPTSAQATLSSTDEKVAKKVNIDNDPAPDFVIQAFRTTGVSAAGVPVAFKVGVRVYDYNAFQRNSASMQTESASLSMTSGEGQRGRRPLAVLYSDIVQSDRNLSLCNYRTYIQSTASTTGIDCS